MKKHDDISKDTFFAKTRCGSTVCEKEFRKNKKPTPRMIFQIFWTRSYGFGGVKRPNCGANSRLTVKKKIDFSPSNACDSISKLEWRLRSTVCRRVNIRFVVLGRNAFSLFTRHADCDRAVFFFLDSFRFTWWPIRMIDTYIISIVCFPIITARLCRLPRSHPRP